MLRTLISKLGINFGINNGVVGAVGAVGTVRTIFSTPKVLFPNSELQKNPEPETYVDGLNTGNLNTGDSSNQHYDPEKEHKIAIRMSTLINIPLNLHKGTNLTPEQIQENYNNVCVFWKHPMAIAKSPTYYEKIIAYENEEEIIITNGMYSKG